MKICYKCNIEKSLDEFTSRKDTNCYENRCNQCTKEYYKQYYINNKKKIMERSNLYYKQNTESVIERSKKYREHNVEKIKKRKTEYHIKNRDSILEKVKNWRKENKEKRNNYETERRKTNNLFKLIHYLRVRTNFYIKKTNHIKNKSSYEIIGCRPEYLKEYLEEQFTQGMTWKNYGEWHIDHIIPLSSATSQDDLYELCHYTNLQPLWAQDNLKKGNKIIKK